MYQKGQRHPRHQSWEFQALDHLCRHCGVSNECKGPQGHKRHQSLPHANHQLEGRRVHTQIFFELDLEETESGKGIPGEGYKIS